MNASTSQSLSFFEEIKQLEARIAALRGDQLRELKERRKAALAELDSIDKEIAKITGGSVSPDAMIPDEQPRRRRISDEDLKGAILKAVAEHGARGLSVTEIAAYVGHDAPRIRRFVSENPKVLKQQSAGRGTRYFLP